MDQPLTSFPILKGEPVDLDVAADPMGMYEPPYIRKARLRGQLQSVLVAGQRRYYYYY